MEVFTSVSTNISAVNPISMKETLLCCNTLQSLGALKPL